MPDLLSKIDPKCPLRKYRGKPKTCLWCGKKLPPRRIRWCSDACPKVYLIHHTWTDARAEAIRLAGGREAPVCRRCKRVTRTPEVNHIIPRYGAGYGAGCHHHQTNLEVLCHAHHVAVTRKQRQARLKLGVDKPKPMPYSRRRRDA